MQACKLWGLCFLWVALATITTGSGAGQKFQSTKVPPTSAPVGPVILGTTASGTEYVSFWSGDLRIFAQRDATTVRLVDIDTGLDLPLTDPRILWTNVLANPFVLASAGGSFEGVGGLGGPLDEIRVRIEATEPVIVWTGSLNASTRHPVDPPDETQANPWGSYIPAFSETSLTNGREVGREFLGFTTRRMIIIARADTATPTFITVTDLNTNTDSDSDDNHTLTSIDAVYSDSEIEVFSLDGFEDDTVRVSSNVDASVLVGYGLWENADWTATPPSYAAGDDGIELGTLFYTYVHRSLTVFPTQDDTTVTITDLSDGDDSVSLTLTDGDAVGDYQFYTPTLQSRSSGELIPRTAGPAVTVLHNFYNPFDDDIVKVESDKPVLVYTGPIASDVHDYADVAFSVPTGPDSQIIYCFAQNHGNSNDLQVFGFDPDTQISVTSLSFTQRFRDQAHHDFLIGPGVGGPGGWIEGVGIPDTEVWWGSGIWAAEVLRIESNKPITVLNGDYDIPHFGAFIPFVLTTPTLPPVAVASASPTEIPPGDPVTLDGTASFDQDSVVGGQPVRYEWDFDIADDSDGDGIPDNDIDATTDIATTSSYQTVGPHTARLTYYDDEGESDTDFVTVIVKNQPPVADAGGPYDVDEGNPVQLDGSGSYDPDGDPLQYGWDLDDDGLYDDSSLVDPVNTWMDDGTYTVGLEVSDGQLQDDDDATVHVRDLGPMADFTWAPEPQSEGSPVQFDDLSISYPDVIVAWEWDFAGLGTSTDQDPSFTFMDDGVHTVTLTVTDDDGSTDTASHDVTVLDLAPVAEFTWTPEPQDEGSPVLFTDQSASYPDAIVAWEWDFAGIGTSTDRDPSFTFMDDGVHTVTLTVTDDDGSTDTVSHDVTVLDLAPTAAFAWAPEPQDEGSPVQFTDQSTSYPDAIVAWEWDFAGLGTSTDQSPSFTFMDDGVHTVTLTVTDDDGSTDTVSHDVTVLDLAPTAAFAWAPEPQDEGSPVQFTDQSASHPDAIVAWEWDFAGLGSSTDRNPDHAFGDNGVYRVTLTITDDDGSRDTITHDVTILNVAPTADAGGDETIDEGSPLALSGSFSDPGWLDTHTFEWDFGDGNTASGSLTPVHSYGDDGVYTVTLTVTDDDGGVGTDTLTVTVDNVAPTIEPFGPFTVDEASPIALAATARDVGSDDLTFTWEWDNGTPDDTATYFNDGAGADPYPSPWGDFPFGAEDTQSHTYGDDGLFTVTLTVEDDDGGVATHTTLVTVENVAPEIASVEAYTTVDITLRVAGEKFHSVGIRILEDGAEIEYAVVTREPGSPDEQSATLAGVRLDRTRTHVALVDYLPNDPRVNGNVWGANPVWIVMTFEDGMEKRLHHTFNVKKSYWQDDHWNHIDPWEVELAPHVAGQEIHFEATASDPGSDDLEFFWEFGDGNSAGPNIYYNDGTGPDPYPSPDINPITASDTAVHSYSTSGTRTVTLTVTDDDGGATTHTLTLDIG